MARQSPRTEQRGEACGAAHTRLADHHRRADAGDGTDTHRQRPATARRGHGAPTHHHRSATDQRQQSQSRPSARRRPQNNIQQD